MAEKKIIELEVKNNLGSLKSQLREAQAEVARLSDEFGVTSKQVIDAAKRAADLKDRIEDANDAIQAFKGEGAFLATGKAINVATSGIAAYEGALGILGVESEKVQETLLKVQSAMALTQGLAGLEDAGRAFTQLGAVIKNQVVTAFATLKSAIITTGIGALVIAIGVLLPKIIEWADWTGRAQRKQEDLNDSLERQQSKIRENRKELERDLDFRLRYARALGKSDEELAKIKEGNTKKTNASIYSEIEAARKRLKALREADLGVMASSREEYNELVKNNRKKREAIVQEIKGLTDNIKRNNEDLLIEQTEQNRKEKEVVEKGVKEKVKIEEETWEESFNRRLKMQEDIDSMRLKPKKLEDDPNSVTARAISEAKELMKIQVDTNKEKQKLDEENAEREKKLAEEVKYKKIQMAQQAFGALGDLATLFADGNEEEQRKAFQLNKAANLGLAIVNTAQAVTGALAEPSIIPGERFVKAALAATVGGINIARISATQFQGTGGGDTATSTPTAPRTPSFDIIQAQPQMQLGALQQQPVKAYVVSGEVSTAQALDRNRVRNATF